jgi:hypothetical protein
VSTLRISNETVAVAKVPLFKFGGSIGVNGGLFRIRHPYKHNDHDDQFDIERTSDYGQYRTKCGPSA